MLSCTFLTTNYKKNRYNIIENVTKNDFNYYDVHLNMVDGVEVL